MPGVATETNGSSENDVTGKVDRRPDNRDEFLCGVVEGFYGRPWTTEQRKDLFTKMQVQNVSYVICAVAVTSFIKSKTIKVIAQRWARTLESVIISPMLQRLS